MPFRRGEDGTACALIGVCGVKVGLSVLRKEKI